MATTHTSTSTPADLQRLDRRMQQRWFDLAMAEQRGQPAHALERMYSAYMVALEDYITCQRALSGKPLRSRLAS
jgi:hypothetical protein